MKAFACVEWRRAHRALESCRQLAERDPDSAASRAYYAAFHALTALFALREQAFSRHSALRAALHRDLIRTDEWPRELGKAYDFLLDLREIGDYGGTTEVSVESAHLAAEKAQCIVQEVARTCPEL